jgi:hypothetical protein
MISTSRIRLLCAMVCVLCTCAFSQRTATSIAGGYAGDGNPATSAALNAPTYATVDLHGVIYVSDTGHCRVRKIDSLGIITTVAGTGVCGFSGDGGPANQAQINLPSGIVKTSSDFCHVQSSKFALR